MLDQSSAEMCVAYEAEVWQTSKTRNGRGVRGISRSNGLCYTTIQSESPAGGVSFMNSLKVFFFATVENESIFRVSY